MASKEEHRAMTVGSRELKTRLGTYLGKVKAGGTIIVTERGRPVAELRPVSSGSTLEAKLYQLAARGLLTLEIREPAPLEEFRPVTLARPELSVSQALIEDRDDRL
jgi:prevent-host-death family protein